MATVYALSGFSDLHDLAGGRSPFVGLTRGKSKGSWALGTTGNECGNYYDGLEYTASANYTGSVFGRTCFFAETSDGNNGLKDITTDIWIVGANPNGKKFDTIAQYKEDPVNDDGTCVDDGNGVSTTYFKYSMSST
jgi:hypothetical protein